MTKILTMVGFSLVMFAASAAATWWWNSQRGATEAAETASTGGAEPAAAATAPAPASAQPAPPQDALPVAVRPRPMSLEELLRFGMGLNQREEALRQRENEMREQQLRVKLVLADLRGEQEAIDGLRARVQSQLESADALLTKLEAARTSLAAERKQAEQDLQTAATAQIQIDELQRENIKQTATWLQAMEPEKAADVLREMANDGRLEHAVKLLAQLEEREVAKILSALDDAKLVDQFIARFQDLRRPSASKSATRR